MSLILTGIFKYLPLFLFVLLFSFADVAFAQDPPPDLDKIFQYIYNGVRFFFGFIGVVAGAMVIYGAYMWMVSGGDPQKTKMAQGVLTWAVIGLVFFMSFWFFFDFILRIFGIELPVPTGTPIEELQR